VKNFVPQVAACGWYKKNAIWAHQWIAEVPKVMCIQCWEPRSDSDLSMWIGYFFSNGFSPYCFVWVFYNKGNSLVTLANIICYRNAELFTGAIL